MFSGGMPAPSAGCCLDGIWLGDQISSFPSLRKCAVEFCGSSGACDSKGKKYSASIVFAAVALKAPRGGAVLCAMLLASVVPIVFWARSAGYFDGAAALLVGSLAISALGLLVALFKLLFGAKPGP